jgi:hypothetical protein
MHAVAGCAASDPQEGQEQRLKQNRDKRERAAALVEREHERETY